MFKEANQSSKDPNVVMTEEELRAKDSEIEIVHLPGQPKPCQYCNKQFRSLGYYLNPYTVIVPKNVQLSWRSMNDVTRAKSLSYANTVPRLSVKRPT